MVDKGVISVNVAKDLTFRVILEGIDPENEVKKLGLTRIEDTEYLMRIVREVLAEYPKAVEDAKKNPKVINFLIGMTMKKSRGRLDPKKAREAIIKELKLKV